MFREEEKNSLTLLNNMANSRQLETFPQKLRRILDDAERECADDIISYCPASTEFGAGPGFEIHDTSRFEKELLPRYFKTTRYTSFLRNMNMYGFSMHRRLHMIPTASTFFHHKLFLKDQPELSGKIKRQKVAVPTGSKGDAPTNQHHASQLLTAALKKQNTDLFRNPPAIQARRTPFILENMPAFDHQIAWERAQQQLRFTNTLLASFRHGQQQTNLVPFLSASDVNLANLMRFCPAHFDLSGDHGRLVMEPQKLKTPDRAAPGRDFSGNKFVDFVNKPMTQRVVQQQGPFFV